MAPRVTLCCALLLSAGCGYIGAPLAPTLDIPTQVRDLRAAEEGSQIRVEFTVGDLTTEGLPLKSLRSVDLYAGPVAGFDAPSAWAASARRFDVPANAPGVLEAQIPAAEWIGKEIVLRVRATGPKGKASEWSNVAVLNVISPLPQPAGLKVESTKDGVALTWRGAGPRYRIFRASGDGMPERLGESDKPEYLDESAQYGTAYRYYVMALADESQRSLVSEPSAPLTPVDKFPPAVPAGVAVALGVNSVELAWERNTETDFRGYHVYRSVGDGPFERVAALIEVPSFTDSKVEVGKTYRYQVSAVDLLDNESGRSEPVSVTVQ